MTPFTSQYWIPSSVTSAAEVIWLGASLTPLKLSAASDAHDATGSVAAAAVSAGDACAAAGTFACAAAVVAAVIDRNIPATDTATAILRHFTNLNCIVPPTDLEFVFPASRERLPGA
jgi:hypothetical protein